MIRFACPRCNSLLARPELEASTVLACPSCGQRLQVPAAPAGSPAAQTSVRSDKPEVSPPAPPPPPFLVANQDAQLPADPPPLPSARSIRSYRGRDDDDYPTIERRSRRGYTSPALAKAAATGLICSLASLGFLLLSFILWTVALPGQGGRLGVDRPNLVMIMLIVIFASFILSLLGVVFSTRGMHEDNTYNRGQATGGLVCGIIGLVVGSIFGLFFMCVGMVIWSIGH